MSVKEYYRLLGKARESLCLVIFLNGFFNLHRRPHAFSLSQQYG